MLIDVCFQVGNGCTGGTLYTLPTCQNLDVSPGFEPGSQGYTKKGPTLTTRRHGQIGAEHCRTRTRVSRLKEVWGFSFCIAPLKLSTVFTTLPRRPTRQTDTRMLTKTQDEKTDTPILTGRRHTKIDRSYAHPGFSSVNVGWSSYRN